MIDLILDPTILIQTLGYVGLFAIAYAESGLLVGFFLPGDSLLFSAGLFAATHVLNIWVLLLIIPIAAVLGDSTGYWFGSFVGPRLFTRSDSFLFNKKHILRAEEFYERHGPHALFLARFIPIIRTFVPIVAGIGRMRYRTFFLWNALGGICWGFFSLLIGYFLGKAIPNAEDYLLPLVIVVIVVSLLPVAWEWKKSR